MSGREWMIYILHHNITLFESSNIKMQDGGAKKSKYNLFRIKLLF